MVDPGDVRANGPLLEWLRSQAVTGRRSVYDIDAWELHTHPDLVDRLRELAPEGTFTPMYGVPTLVGPNGIVFAYALGTSALSVRDSIPVPAGVRVGTQHPPIDGWVTIEPWPVDIELREGTALLTRHMLELIAALS